MEVPFRGDWVVLAGTDLPTDRSQREYRFLSGGIDAPAPAAGRAILASETAARRFGLSVGGQVEIQKTLFTVCGVYRDYSETRGILLLDLAVFRRVTGIQELISIAAHVQPGHDVGALHRALTAEPTMRGTLIQQNRDLRAAIMQIFDDTFRVTSLIRWIVLFICAGGFLVTVLQLVWERRQELRTLELLGTSRRQLRGAILGEGSLLALSASVIGVPAGLALALILITLINPISFGWTLSLFIQPAAVLIPPALVLGAGIAGAALAGFFHLRVIEQAPTRTE